MRWGTRIQLCVEEELRRPGEASAILENSGVGDRQANGAAQRAVQALGELLRVLNAWSETRLGSELEGTHQVLASHSMRG